MQKFPKAAQTFFLPGKDGALEVMTAYPDGEAKGIAIVCHPHPLYEGTMHNKVVTTAARAYENVGLATVRFNFRGVGKSEGSYGHTIGEAEDLWVMIEWVQKSLPSLPLILCGFSFGAYIAAKVANELMVNQLVSIAPAVNHADFQSLRAIKSPWLLVQGDQDEVVPFEEVKNFALHPPAPLKFIVVEECSHFFHGKLIELREILENNCRLS